VPTTAEVLSARIRAIKPGLKIDELELSDEGLTNDVAIVNNKYVFRFARTEQGRADLDNEAQVRDLVRAHVDIAVPEADIVARDCLCYPFLSGDPLLLETIQGMTDSGRDRVARDLGRFLFDLHSIDVSRGRTELPPTLAPVTRDRWLKIYEGIKATVYPLLWKHQARWAESVFNEMLADECYFDYRPALIHGDLRQYHVLIDRTEGRLAGVIDFGVAGIGDPASDFGTLINTYGESFVVRMRDVYPGLDRFLPRARFYAQALELHWVWLGIELKEDFWFAAHLACARDLKSES
jgi:aminoglycoside 2''-phosphotransferase